jgi:tetratricopeptide (TPR) repeat protein
VRRSQRANTRVESSPSAALQRALAHHHRGQLVQAEALYGEVLRGQPRNFDALHLSGVIAGQRNQLERACELIGAALESDPDNVAAFAALTNLGSALSKLGRVEAALQSYDRALALNARYTLAHLNRADLLSQLKQWNAALGSYDRAIASGANDPAMHFRRGNVLVSLKRWSAALASYDTASALGCDTPELHSNRAAILNELTQWHAALSSSERAIALRADHAQAHCNRGSALRGLRRLDEALACYDRAVALDERCAEIHSSRAAILNDLRQWGAGLVSCDRAIALNAELAEAHCNRGAALHGLGKLDAALASFDRAIELRTNYSEAYSNRGNVLKDLQQFDVALASYASAIALKPDYAEAHCNRALVLLLTRRFEDGWREYEWRWSSRHGSNIRERRQFSQPPWLGTESLAGKRLLLYSEQGLGDTLQFCRYVRPVAAMGAIVVLEVQPELTELLSCLSDVAQLVPKGGMLPDFDLHCSLLSAPRVLQTHLDSIPSGASYLQADAVRVAQWRDRLGEHKRLRVGLTWSGNAVHTNDHNRSIPLAELVHYLPREIEYVCLQKDIRPRDAAVLSGSVQIWSAADRLTDFSETAALCECLDLVVSVDTSIAHLSGALGKETWILLPHPPDWRWLLDRDDSPWYPSVKLYRQRSYGHWNDALEGLATDLQQRLHGKSAS